jgi:hypothetical protein
VIAAAAREMSREMSNREEIVGRRYSGGSSKREE